MINPMNMLSGMGNNPISQLVNVLNSGGNPLAMMQQFSGSDPRVQQAMQMMKGKNAQQLQEMAKNLAANQGTTVEEIIRGLGIKM